MVGDGSGNNRKEGKGGRSGEKKERRKKKMREKNIFRVLFGFSKLDFISFSVFQNEISFFCIF